MTWLSLFLHCETNEKLGHLKNCFNYPKIRTMVYHRVKRPKDGGGMAVSVDHDQTTPAVWSGSTLFIQTCLSKN